MLIQVVRFCDRFGHIGEQGNRHTSSGSSACASAAAAVIVASELVTPEAPSAALQALAVGADEGPPPLPSPPRSQGANGRIERSASNGNVFSARSNVLRSQPSI